MVATDIFSILSIVLILIISLIFMNIEKCKDPNIQNLKDTCYVVISLLLMILLVTSFITAILYRVDIENLKRSNIEQSTSYEEKIKQILESGKNDTLTIGDEQIIFRFYDYEKE